MASRKKKEKAFNVLAFFIVLILAALVLLPILGISGTEKVFLATCDEENTLSVYLRVRDRKDMDIFT